MIMVMVKKDNFDGHGDYYGDGYYGSFIIMIIEYYDGNDNGEIDIVYGDGPLSCEDLQLKFWPHVMSKKRAAQAQLDRL